MSRRGDTRGLRYAPRGWSQRATDEGFEGFQVHFAGEVRARAVDGEVRAGQVFRNTQK